PADRQAVERLPQQRHPLLSHHVVRAPFAYGGFRSKRRKRYLGGLPRSAGSRSISRPSDRISSIVVSTRIVASIVFGHANHGLLAEAPCDGEPAAPRATATKRRSASASADERCYWPEARTGLVWKIEAAVGPPVTVDS